MDTKITFDSRLGEIKPAQKLWRTEELQQWLRGNRLAVEGSIKRGIRKKHGLPPTKPILEGSTLGSEQPVKPYPEAFTVDYFSTAVDGVTTYHLQRANGGINATYTLLASAYSPDPENWLNQQMARFVETMEIRAKAELREIQSEQKREALAELAASKALIASDAHLDPRIRRARSAVAGDGYMAKVTRAAKIVELEATAKRTSRPFVNLYAEALTARKL